MTDAYPWYGLAEGDALQQVDWLQKVTGAMKGRPEFLEMAEHGRRYRESLPYSDEDPEAW